MKLNLSLKTIKHVKIYNKIFKLKTSTTLSRRLTMHLSDTSSIAHHLKKKIHAQQENYGKFLPKTTIFEHQNNKQKLLILVALHIRNILPKRNRINFEARANVLTCL